MERYALAFRIKEGTQPEVVDLLSNYTAPRLITDDGTRLLGTSVFTKGTLVVRVLEIDGDMAKVGPHLARDPIIRKVEDALVPHLVDGYDPADPKARAQLFARRMTERLTHRGEPAPAGSRHALLYPIKPGMADIAAKVLVAAGDPPLQSGGTTLYSTTVFRQGDMIVRIFEIEGSIDELIAGLATSIEVADVGDRMAGIFSGDYDFRTVEGLTAFFADSLMQTVTDRRAEPPVEQA